MPSIRGALQNEADNLHVLSDPDTYDYVVHPELTEYTWLRKIKRTSYSYLSFSSMAYLLSLPANTYYISVFIMLSREFWSKQNGTVPGTAGVEGSKGYFS